MKVFIIHGWTYSLDQWKDLCDLLQKKGLEVVQLKVPGLSTPTDKVWDMDGYVDWLHKELQGEAEPVVIGHSNGGRIALNYVNRHPKSLGKLILIDSAGIYHGDLWSKTKRGTFKAVAKLGKPLAKVPVAKKVFYRLIGAKDYAKASPNMKQTMANMLAADRALELSNITIPVWLIWGSEDPATPLSDGRKLSQRLHNAPLTIVAGAKHSPHGSHPEQVAQIIMHVLEEKP